MKNFEPWCWTLWWMNVAEWPTMIFFPSSFTFFLHSLMRYPDYHPKDGRRGYLTRLNLGLNERCPPPESFNTRFISLWESFNYRTSSRIGLKVYCKSKMTLESLNLSSTSMAIMAASTQEGTFNKWLIKYYYDHGGLKKLPCHPDFSCLYFGYIYCLSWTFLILIKSIWQSFFFEIFVRPPRPTDEWIYLDGFPHYAF